MTEHPFFMKLVWEHETAVSFLKKYGNHQSFDSFGIDEQISEIEASLKKLRRNLKNLKWGYIAPKGAYVNCKNPKGGDVNNNSESPRFYVLKSSKAQFKSKKDPSKKISNLYLCNDIFLANYEVIQARVGIKRRDHLQKISKKLMKAVSELQKAIDEADVNFNFDDHDNNWDFEERDFDGMDIYRLVRKDRQKSLLE